MSSSSSTSSSTATASPVITVVDQITNVVNVTVVQVVAPATHPIKHKKPRRHCGCRHPKKPAKKPQAPKPHPKGYQGAPPPAIGLG